MGDVVYGLLLLCILSDAFATAWYCDGAVISFYCGFWAVLIGMILVTRTARFWFSSTALLFVLIVDCCGLWIVDCVLRILDSGSFSILDHYGFWIILDSGFWIILDDCGLLIVDCACLVLRFFVFLLLLFFCFLFFIFLW
jgi:hypothetical protein